VLYSSIPGSAVEKKHVACRKINEILLKAS